MNTIGLITIGSDRSICDPQSSACKRQQAYRASLREMHIIIFSLRSHKLEEKEIVPGLHVYPTNSRNRLLYVFDAMRIALRVVTRVMHNGLCVISTQDPFEAGFVGARVAQKMSVPLHVQIHTDIGSPYFRTHNILNRIRMYIAAFVIPRVRAFRVVSARIADTLTYQYGVSVESITILPIRTEFNPQERRVREKPYILVVSRLEAEKRVMDAIRIFAEVVKVYPDFVLKIVGDGREKGALMQYVQKHGLESRVEFLGYITDVAPLYAHAHVLLHTALYEGFGLVLYEAGRAGCPIVSTDVGIARDVHKSGYPIEIVPVDRVAELRVHVQKFLRTFETGVLHDRFHMISDVHVYRDAYIASLAQAVRE